MFRDIAFCPKQDGIQLFCSDSSVVYPQGSVHTQVHT